MFCRWIGSFSSYNDTTTIPKPICSRTKESPLFTSQPEVLNNYYNGLQKLFSGHYAVFNGNGAKRTEEFPAYKERPSSRVKLFPLQQPEAESELIDFPIPNFNTTYKSFELPNTALIQSPHLSALKLDPNSKSSRKTKQTPIAFIKPNDVGNISDEEKVKPGISSDLD